MSWTTIAWSMGASASLTLAIIHLVIWCKQTDQRAHLLFSVTAISVAGIAACELLIMHAQSPEQLGRVIWWAHIPVFFTIVSIVGFVRLYFNAGRPWIGYAVCGLRLLEDLVINFFSVPNVNYERITGLRHMTILGGETISVAQGVESPWVRVSELSSLLFLVFVVDASVTLWRRGHPGERRRAVIVGGSMTFFILVAAGTSALIEAGVLQSPYLISFSFLAIVAAMGYELSLDVVRAAQLARQLQASEATLRESEARFRILADTAPVMVWMSGTDMLCNFFNKPWLEFTGRTVEQELGNGWSEGVHPEDLQGCLETYVCNFNARQPFTMEYRLRRADGEYRWVLDNGVPRYTPEGEFAGYIGSCMDITERRRAEAALRENEQHMGLAASAAELALWMWDIPRDEVWTTDKGRALFGFTQSEKINFERFLDALHPEDRDAVCQAVAEAVNGAGEYESEYRVVLPGGQARWIAGRGRVEFGCGKPVRMRGVSLDITRRKQAEAEARQYREELAHLSRVAIMGEMAGSLAHELNQPLTGIVNNASAGRRFIAKGHADLPKLDGLFEAVVADGRRAGGIIRGIRGMVRKGEQIRGPVNLNDVIAGVVRFVRSDALERHCVLVTEPDPELPLVEADLVQLQQVLLNLVVNAFEAMGEKPTVERRVIIRSERVSEGRVRVSVRDFGTGLPAEESQRIFEQFFSTKREGMGMGLAIARSIIVSHGGELAATNAEGGGACVHFSLPVIAKGQGG